MCSGINATRGVKRRRLSGALLCWIGSAWENRWISTKGRRDVYCAARTSQWRVAGIAAGLRRLTLLGLKPARRWEAEAGEQVARLAVFSYLPCAAIASM